MDIKDQLHSFRDEAGRVTPARVGVGTTGTRPYTRELLKLRLEHAAAVDAVYGEVSDATLQSFDLFTVNTKAGNKETYLQRPEYGRQLTSEAERTITDRCVLNPQVQIVISDGLSARAIEANLADILPALLQSLAIHNLEAGTPFFVKGGRVGCMDHIGQLLHPEVCVLLIGERPGLAAAGSMSAYMCYRPGPGTLDSDRMVISNIHHRGTPPVEAGAHIGSLLRKMVDQQASGVKLVL